MTYDEAMAYIHKRAGVSVGRQDDPKMRVAWRFGRPVLLTITDSFIDYTPTREEMTATDWRGL